MRIRESVNETFRASLKETHGKESWEKLEFLKEIFQRDELYQMFMDWLDEREAVEMLDNWAHQHQIEYGPFADPDEGDVY